MCTLSVSQTGWQLDQQPVKCRTTAELFRIRAGQQHQHACILFLDSLIQIKSTSSCNAKCFTQRAQRLSSNTTGSIEAKFSSGFPEPIGVFAKRLLFPNHGTSCWMLFCKPGFLLETANWSALLRHNWRASVCDCDCEYERVQWMICTARTPSALARWW